MPIDQMRRDGYREARALQRTVRAVAASIVVAIAGVAVVAVGAVNGVPRARAAGTGSGAAGTEASATKPAGADGGAEKVTFSDAYLTDPANIEAGEALWKKQCRHCHGKAAYPGKAPKLKPRRYTPDFVYDRVTYGFRKMPAWKDVYSREERKAVVAYVLSPEFSP